MCMEGETEGVDSVRLAVRVYSLVWGEEGIMQDGGVVLKGECGQLSAYRMATPNVGSSEHASY